MNNTNKAGRRPPGDLFVSFTNVDLADDRATADVLRRHYKSQDPCSVLLRTTNGKHERLLELSVDKLDCLDLSKPADEAIIQGDMPLKHEPSAPWTHLSLLLH